MEAAHSVRHWYVSHRSSASSRAVCGLFDLVARMKWFGMMGYLFRMREWVGFSVGIWAMRRAGSGCSKGSNGFLVTGLFVDEEVAAEVVALVLLPLAVFRVGFFASAGQYRSWNYMY